MGLKCSVLGHRFGETAVEREREEDGTEVVITIREIETCTRCGEERIVSENKEVTTLETPDESAAGEDGAATTDEPAADADEATADAAADPAEDDATILGDDTDDTAAEPDDAGPADTATADVDTAEASPEKDDAEIIESDPEAESSAQAEARSASDTEIPDAEGSAEPDAATTGEDDAIIIDDEDEADPDPNRDPGEWPDEPDGGNDGPAADWPSDQGGPTTEDGAPEEADPEPEPESTGAGMGDWPEETKRSDVGGSPDDAPGLTAEERDAITVPEGMFKCSECGFTTEVESSSLRAGDFCPECHRGTLLQHRDADAE